MPYLLQSADYAIGKEAVWPVMWVARLVQDLGCGWKAKELMISFASYAQPVEELHSVWMR